MNALRTVLTLAFLAGAALAQNPSDTLSVSGVLKDSAGNPATGPVSIAFTIYDDATAGTALWTETHPAVVLDANGRYQVALGSVTPLTATAFVTQDRWLTANVNRDGEMTPRLPLGTSPYAHNANLLDGSPASTFAAAAQLDDGNPSTTPVGWSDLSAMPVGFADGTDNVNDADSDPTNEIETWSTLAGKPAGFADNTDDVNDADSDPTNEIETWSTLAGIPAGFADNTDDIATWSTLTGIPGGFADGIDNVDDGDWAVMGSDLLLELTTATRVGIGGSTAATRLDVTTVGGLDLAAVRAAGTNSTFGYLGTQGQDDFDGELTLDLDGDEIGVLGVAVDGVTADNFGVLGHSSGAGGRFSHTSGSNTVDLAGVDFVLSSNQLRILPGGRIWQQNNGGSVFVGNLAGGNDDLSLSNLNCAIGYRALEDNVGGQKNTAIGALAMLDFNAASGDAKNTAVGYRALEDNVGGQENTAIGAEAMLHFNVASGDTRNTAIGFAAMQDATSGSFNTALGSFALEQTLTSDENVAIGGGTMRNFDYGNANTGVGRNAEGNAASQTNSTALGHDSLFTASNQVRIGNTAITSIGGHAAWSNLSDGRFKRDVAEDVPGLEFIQALRPVSYTVDPRAVNGFLAPHRSDYTAEDEAAFDAKSRILETGFIAQEVEAAAADLGYDFSGVDAPKNERDAYGLRYATFVVPLVKAVQEQQVLIDELRSELAELRKEVEEK